MSKRSLSGREGALRLYDGSPTPNYIEISFVAMNFNAPLARARSNDPIVPTVGGAIMAPTSPEYDAGFFEPSQLSFSLWVNSVDWNVHRAAFSNIDMANPWKVGSTTWTSTKGRGSIQMPDSTFRATPAFFDEKKKAVDVQVRWTSPATSGSIIGMRYDEAYFAPQSLSIVESPDFVEIRASGLVYGNIQPIGDFSTGTSSI